MIKKEEIQDHLEAAAIEKLEFLISLIKNKEDGFVFKGYSTNRKIDEFEVTFEFINPLT